MLRQEWETPCKPPKQEGARPAPAEQESASRRRARGCLIKRDMQLTSQ